MGVGALGGRGAAAPAPGSASSEGECGLHLGGGGRMLKSARSRARVAPEPGHLALVRDPKKREAGFGPGTARAPRAVPEESDTPPPPPRAPAVGCSTAWGHCQVLPGIGRARGVRSGRASVTNLREKDLGPKEK